MRVALYARVSTESQQARGTIGSQLAVLRERVGAEGDEVVAEFCDDGHSGARLDRPGLDALRDAAEAGLIERVWCLSPDRLARVYAYQVIVLDELARHGVERAVHRRPTARRRPAGQAAHPGPGGDRRVRAGEDRRTVPAREAVPLPRRGGAGLAHPLRLPPPAPRRARPGPAGGVRTRGRGRAADLRRLRPRRALAARDHPPAGRRQGPAPGRPRPAVEHLHAEQAAAQRGLHRAGLRQPHRSRPRPAPRAAQQAGPPPPRGLDRHRGARHRRRARPSRRPGGSAATTASGARAGPNPANGCCVAWSSAGSAASARTATRGAAATAPGTATTTAATTTRSKPAGTTGAAPNATSAPTPSTRSCSTRSAPRCCAPTCSPPANRPSPCAPPPPTTNCSPPSWPAWTASSTPPTPNAAASSTSTRPASSSYPSCSAAPPTSSTAAATSTNAATPSPRNATSSPATTSCATASVDFASRVLDVIDTLDFDQKQTLLRLVVEEVHVTGWHVQIRLRIPLDDNPDGPPRPPNPDPGPDRPGPVSTEDRLRSLGNQEVDLPEPLRSPTARRRHRRADRTDGAGEPDLGLPAHPGRTAQTRPPRRRLHDPQDPQAAPDTAGTAASTPTRPGGGSCAPRPRPCWPWTSSTSTARSPCGGSTSSSPSKSATATCTSSA